MYLSINTIIKLCYIVGVFFAVACSLVGYTIKELILHKETVFPIPTEGMVNYCARRRL